MFDQYVNVYGGSWGNSAVLGKIWPIVDMQVKFGENETRWIRSVDSGNYQVELAMTSGGAVVGKAYPHMLYVSQTVANYFDWPNTNSVLAGHSGTPPVGNSSYIHYLKGDGTIGQATR